MKLAALYFDDQVVIPGYVAVSGGTSQYRDTTFHADEGWDIQRVERGVFRIWREGMPAPVMLEGYGASWVEMPESSSPAAEPSTGKRRRGQP